MALSKPENDLFLCPVCSETYKSPKILPCLHTFCEECIHEYIVSFGRKGKDKISEFPCPVCKISIDPGKPDLDITKWASSLRSNSTMSAMIAEANGKHKQNCDVCSDHNELGIAQFWCKECSRTFCFECNTKHSWLYIKSILHTVCPLKEVGERTNGIDLSVVSEECIKHPTEVIHSICFDHNCVCCVICITHDHRGCKNVKTVSDVISSDIVADKFQNLNNTKEDIIKLVESKRSECADFEAKATKIEDEAAKMIQSLKFKLDELFETFKKQLHILRDDQLTEMDVGVRMLNELLQSLEHWINSARIVKKSGSNAQFWIYLDKIDKQLKVSVGEMVRNKRYNTTIDLAFVKNIVLNQVQSLDQLGTISVVEQKLINQLEHMNKLSRTFSAFETVKLEKVNTLFHSGSKLKCGVCIGDGYLLLGDFKYGNSKIFLMDKQGSVLSSCKSPDSGKRICYVPEKKHFYISCYASGMFKAVLDGQIVRKPIEMIYEGGYVGDIEKHRDLIYVVGNGAIYKFSPVADFDGSPKMTKCFDTNTNSSGLNGIHVEDSYIVFSTTDNQIKCVAHDGTEKYCYKDGPFQLPTCLTVLSSGLILIGDYNGSVHVLSADGKQSRVLLDKFEHVKRISDIWIDTDGSTLYIAGECEYVEVYKVF